MAVRSDRRLYRRRAAAVARYVGGVFGGMGVWSGEGGGPQPRAVHPFPARMSGGFARELIEGAERERSAGGSDDDPMTIVDPMVGSGTVLGAARDRGHRAIGFDIDPLAVLISGVGHCGGRTGVEDDEARDGHPSNRAVCDEAGRVLEEARQIVTRGVCGGYDCDDETRAFMSYWFDEVAARQLGALSAKIRTVDDSPTRNVLWCAFSRLIIAKQAGASRAADLAHSRPHRQFEMAPRRPFNWFAHSVGEVIRAMPMLRGIEGPSCGVAMGDARRLGMPSGSVDMVLTSPPYVNAIDYLRCSKFSLVWMGYRINRLRDIRSVVVGTEVGLRGPGAMAEVSDVLSVALDREKAVALGDRRLAILARYARDMLELTREVERVLTDNAWAVFIVADNYMRGTRVRTPELVRAAAEMAGLTTQPIRYRDIPAAGRYLPPPVSGGAHRRGRNAHPSTLDGRMRCEAVVITAKS